MVVGADQASDAVAALVATHAGVPAEQVRPTTRLWHDLKLAGDDFAELIEELNRTHDVTLRGQLGDYCPTEGDLYWAFWSWPFTRKKIYRELTVAELTVAAHMGAYVG